MFRVLHGVRDGLPVWWSRWYCVAAVAAVSRGAKGEGHFLSVDGTRRAAVVCVAVPGASEGGCARASSNPSHAMLDA